MIEIVQAIEPNDFNHGRALFRDYASGLGVDLGYQNFEQELLDIERMYSPPTGCLLLAKDAEDVFGCVAVRALGREMCELKRLYVRETHRDLGWGVRLSKQVINRAKMLGYRRIRLDTLPTMIAAQGLYRRLGFVEIDAYYDSPIAGTVFMELELSLGS